MWERLDPEIHHTGVYIHSATFALCGRPGSRYSPEDLLLHTQVPAFDTEPVHTAWQGRYYGIQTTIAIAASLFGSVYLPSMHQTHKMEEGLY